MRSACQVLLQIRKKERSLEELKSKGRIQRERQWGSKVKGFSVLQNISKEMVSLCKGFVNHFSSQVGRDKLSLPELKKGTLVYSQAEGQSPPGKSLSMNTITRALKSKSKKWFPAWSQSWLLPATGPFLRFRERKCSLCQICLCLSWGLYIRLTKETKKNKRKKFISMCTTHESAYSWENPQMSNSKKRLEFGI